MLRRAVGKAVHGKIERDERRVQRQRPRHRRRRLEPNQVPGEVEVCDGPVAEQRLGYGLAPRHKVRLHGVEGLAGADQVLRQVELRQRPVLPDGADERGALRVVDVRRRQSQRAQDAALAEQKRAQVHRRLVDVVAGEVERDERRTRPGAARHRGLDRRGLASRVDAGHHGGGHGRDAGARAVGVVVGRVGFSGGVVGQPDEGQFPLLARVGFSGSFVAFVVRSPRERVAERGDGHVGEAVVGEEEGLERPRHGGQHFCERQNDRVADAGARQI
mmetsp:Transcript_32431/g.109297  ORF Transcript_32431/g.109297 Transcript_32431/m.109297 type:complete len:274 (-) Transcript_32431:519-1340(-)